ncbi:uncharacterized protein LOC112231745 [Oncorhynchus tshawytscha]|uniref:uncharacterized protein LOC112231745 n=1 Tax=Oncorhynchus tshawytscha TaxID=74940 RepID=UPI000D0A3C15|nr:uncharacterized protein LOC112231745 [Oncorhynchus tshawytscha]
MKANITLALSMLSLVLLIFVHEATPVSNGAFNENTQTEKTNMRGGLLNDTRNSTDQSTPEKHDRGMHGNHSGMTIAPPNGTPTSTESQTSATSGNTTQQTEKTTSPSLTKQTIPTSLPKTSPSTSTNPSHNKPSPALLNTGFIVVLVIILLLAITVLCFYKWNSRHSGQDGSAPRLLLGVRERMRGRVRSLEDWLGLSLWPGKRVVEGDEEEGEGGKSGDGEAAAGVRGGQDEGDSSDDYSSLDGIDLSERAKNLEDDEKKEALKRKSGSEGGQYNMKGERTDGRKEGGEEERTGKNSSEGDTCDLTAL